MSEIKTQKSKLWFHIFCNFIESGKLAKTSGSSIKVYLVIKSHINFSTGIAKISISTIARKSGVSISQTKREIKSLIATGLLKKSNPGRCNNYQIREQITLNINNTDNTFNWDYKPNGVTAISSEITHFQKTGEQTKDSELKISTPRIEKPIKNKEINLDKIPSYMQHALKRNVPEEKLRKNTSN